MTLFLIYLYWKDAVLGKDKEYMDNGFTIVTAGYQSDFRFLKRLKTFIKLSDFTMSNAVGTHVGYCVVLDKPHYIFSQKISYKSDLNADPLGVTESFNNSVEQQKKI